VGVFTGGPIVDEVRGRVRISNSAAISVPPKSSGTSTDGFYTIVYSQSTHSNGIVARSSGIISNDKN